MFIIKNCFVTSCVYDKEKDDVVWNSILRVGKGYQGFLFLFSGIRRSVLVYGKPSWSYVHFNALSS